MDGNNQFPHPPGPHTEVHTEAVEHSRVKKGVTSRAVDHAFIATGQDVAERQSSKDNGEEHAAVVMTTGSKRDLNDGGVEQGEEIVARHHEEKEKERHARVALDEARPEQGIFCLKYVAVKDA